MTKYIMNKAKIMTYEQIAFKELSKPHGFLTIKKIHELTNGNHGTSVIRDLKKNHSIYDCERKNPKTGKYFKVYMMGRKF